MATDHQANDVPPRVRYRSDTPFNPDREKLIEAVYLAQVDLQLLVCWLATQPDPEIPYGALSAIHYYRHFMAEIMPSLARH